MKRFLILTLACLTLFPPSGRALDFLVTVHGTRKCAKGAGIYQKIATQSVNNRTLYLDFGVSPSEYVLIFDNTFGVLKFVGKRAADQLPSLSVLQFGTRLGAAIDSGNPSGDLVLYTLASPASTTGTAFSKLQGTVQIRGTYKEVDGARVQKAISGAVTGITTEALPTEYLYNFTFSTSKLFQP